MAWNPALLGRSVSGFYHKHSIEQPITEVRSTDLVDSYSGLLYDLDPVGTSGSPWYHLRCVQDVHKRWGMAHYGTIFLRWTSWHRLFISW